MSARSAPRDITRADTHIPTVRAAGNRTRHRRRSSPVGSESTPPAHRSERTPGRALIVGCAVLAIGVFAVVLRRLHVHDAR